MLSPKEAFVGRQRELSRLTATLNDVLDGQGRIVMLAGEPGIGKSRTAQEVAQRADDVDFQILWGRCHEAQGAPPYWPWIRILQAYIEKCDVEQLRALMGAGASDIAELVPEVHERLPDLKSPPPLEPEQARFRLIESITAFLKRAAQHQPILIVLDDLHHADTSSLVLIEFLAREIAASHIFLLGTYRDTDLTRRHPLARTLGEVAGEPVVSRIIMEGLSEDEVAQVIKSYSEATSDEDLVRDIVAKTEGNPLFVTEVVRILDNEGQLHASNKSYLSLAAETETLNITVPLGIRETISNRLNRLSERCHETLILASVIGKEFDLDLLKLLLADAGKDLTTDELLEDLEEAIETRIVEEQPSVVGRFQFTHVLIRDTLASELSAARRASLYGRIGELLESTCGEAAASNAAVLAYYFAQAAPIAGAEKLVEYSLLAGEQALATYAYEESLVYFQRGLSARGVSTEGREPAKDAQVAALLLGLGRAWVTTVDKLELQQAVDCLHRSFDYYAEAGDVTEAVAVVEDSGFVSAGSPTGMAQLIERALALVPSDSHLASRLLPRYGYVLALEEGDQQRAQEVFRRALTIAHQLQDAGLELRTLAEAAMVDRYLRRFHESLKKCLRAIDLVQRVDDLRSAIIVRYEAAIALEVLGDPTTAQQHVNEMMALAERLRDQSWVSAALYELTSLSCAQGDWETARESSDRSVKMLTALPRDIARRSLLEYETGSLVQGDAYLERLLDLMRLYPPGPITAYMYPAFVIPAVARITGDASHLDVGEEAARAVLESPTVTHVIATYARFGLGLLAVQRDDASTAIELYVTLEPERNTMLLGGLGSTDRLLGLLAQTVGNEVKAAQHFDDGMAFCRKAGFLPELAWTSHDYAEMLLEGASANSARMDETNKAVLLLKEARSISIRLGMRPLTEKIDRLEQKIQSQTPSRPVYPDGLTQREVEVLRLIASGMTDRQIADALFVSARTVSTHVHNILSKTNTANRTEATTYAARQSLI